MRYDLGYLNGPSFSIRGKVTGKEACGQKALALMFVSRSDFGRAYGGEGITRSDFGNGIGGDFLSTKLPFAKSTAAAILSSYKYTDRTNLVSLSEPIIDSVSSDHYSMTVTAETSEGSETTSLTVAEG